MLTVCVIKGQLFTRILLLVGGNLVGEERGFKWQEIDGMHACGHALLLCPMVETVNQVEFMDKITLLNHPHWIVITLRFIETLNSLN